MGQGPSLAPVARDRSISGEPESWFWSGAGMRNGGRGRQWEITRGKLLLHQPGEVQRPRWSCCKNQTGEKLRVGELRFITPAVPEELAL